MALTTRGIAGGTGERGVAQPPPVRLATYFRWNAKDRAPRLNRKQRKYMASWERLWQRYVLELLRLPQHKSPWALGVTSSVRGEGRTTGAIALALTLARETNLDIGLVEADFERPQLADLFALEGSAGLVHIFAEKCALDDVIRPAGLQNLWILPSRPVDEPWGDSSAATTAFRRRLPSLLPRLKERFSYVVVDLPPVLEDANAVALAGQLDGLILVVRVGSTPLAKLSEAVKGLHGVEVLGTVNLGTDSAIPRWLASTLLE